MNRVIARPSVAISEATVTGPYRPTNNIVPLRPRTQNSDNPLAPKQLRPSQLRPVTSQPAPQPAQAQAAQPKQPKRSVGKMLASLAGVLMCSVGVVGGLVSIVGLGPIGLAVAVGAAVVGAIFIKLGTKQ